jgi:transposase InsO family protein
MPGKRITNQQIRLYMKLRNTGTTQDTSSAKAGMSERTGRRIEHGPIPRPKPSRHWRTRTDPLRLIWDKDLVPLLEAKPGLLPITLFEWLEDNYPGQYQKTIMRTLQRRIKKWRAIHGPSKEVIFRQKKQPGRLGLSDFTQLKRVTISIANKTFSHLLYHYRLAFSGWCYVKIICGGESFSALSTGLQDALFKSGGAPTQHRTDSLSAAFNNLSTKEDLTKRYQQLCTHYGIEATRNNVGKGHENGAIESPHGHFKRRLEQALLLRGNNNFIDILAYQSFIDKVVKKINHSCLDLLEEEQQHLSPLPIRRTTDYSEQHVRVTSSSTISLRRVTYSVASRLIGEKLCVHLYDDHLDIYHGHINVMTMTRLYAEKFKRVRCIDYRHIIGSLARKPQAFRYSQLRDDLLPTDEYQYIWTNVDLVMNAQDACRYIVKLLALAAKHDCETVLASYVIKWFNQNKRFPSIDRCYKKFAPIKVVIPVLSIDQHPLKDYDQLLHGVTQQIDIKEQQVSV